MVCKISFLSSKKQKCLLLKNRPVLTGLVLKYGLCSTQPYCLYQIKKLYREEMDD